MSIYTHAAGTREWEPALLQDSQVLIITGFTLFGNFVNADLATRQFPIRTRINADSR